MWKLLASQYSFHHFIYLFMHLVEVIFSFALLNLFVSFVFALLKFVGWCNKKEKNKNKKQEKEKEVRGL